jgi:hypothetical protein
MRHVADTPITLLARILIAKHGRQAAEEAAERLSQWMKVGNTDIARLWAQVIQVILTMTATEEPQRADTLDERVIRAPKDSSIRRDTRSRHP